MKNAVINEVAIIIIMKGDEVIHVYVREIRYLFTNFFLKRRTISFVYNLRCDLINESLDEKGELHLPSFLSNALYIPHQMSQSLL